MEDVSMAKTIDMEKCGTIINELFHNTTVAPKLQCSEMELCKKTQVSLMTLRKVKSILIKKHLIIPQGHGKTAHTLWNKSYSTPTPSMVAAIYQEHVNRSLKVVNPKEERRMSLEKAIKTLVSAGFKGEIRRPINDFSYEVIDLGAIEW